MISGPNMISQSPLAPLGRTARREYRQGRARLNILEAAAAVFQEKGLAGTRLQDIADRSGYTVPTLYHYFRNKEAIVEALFVELNQELLETFSRLPPKGYTFEQSLEFFMRQIFELTDRRRGLVLLVIDLHEQPSSSRLKTCTNIQKLHEAIVEWLGQVLDGATTHWPLDEMGRFLLGLWHAHTTLWLMEVNAGRLVDRAVPICQMALHGILKGICMENSLPTDALP